jgi:hypothetical protein
LGIKLIDCDRVAVRSSFQELGTLASVSLHKNVGCCRGVRCLKSNSDDDEGRERIALASVFYLY